MAGVYIKGMKMPENCWECKFEKIFSSHADGIYCVCIIAGTHIDDGQEDWCPLVSVPDHGDLIDRDEMRKEMTVFSNRRTEDAAMTGNRAIRIDWNDALDFIKSASVVIPADKEEV